MLKADPTTLGSIGGAIVAASGVISYTLHEIFGKNDNEK